MCSELELQPHPIVFIRVGSYPNSTFAIVHSFAFAESGASSSWVMIEIPSELLSLLHFPTCPHWCPLIFTAISFRVSKYHDKRFLSLLLLSLQK